MSRNGAGQRVYNLTPAQRGVAIEYKGHRCEIHGQLCLIYAQGSTRQAIWQVFGEYDEAKKAIDSQEWEK